MTAPDAVSCAYCGRSAPDSAGERVMAGWSTQLDQRRGQTRPSVLCPACTRVHTRDIEAKLDEQFWA